MEHMGHFLTFASLILPVMRILNIHFLFMLLTGTAISVQAQENPLIAISKGSSSESYLAYGAWLKNLDPEIHWIDMSVYTVDSALSMLERCSGLLLSGGEDVYPGRYGKESDTARCDKPDLERDTLEFDLIQKAGELKLPILGICRGLQILNVAYGGSLIIDIPQDIASTIHRCPDKFNCFHEVAFLYGSFINKVTGSMSGRSNTNHHQAIDQLAGDLVATGWSGDGIIEAIEWKNPAGKPYLLGVQWHPERMDLSSPLSLKTGLSFIQAAREYMLNENK